jgi:anthranilate synthase component II
MILLIDNYDSFTYNLYQYIGDINKDVIVYRNDKTTPEEIKKIKPTHIILSPGPGYPKDAGICEAVIKDFAGKIPILGVCLGHQAIGEVFNAQVGLAKKLVHGKQSDIHIANGSEIFLGLAPIIKAARYHSLIVEKEALPDELLVIAESAEGEIMGIKHRDYNVFGVQFHPESIMTPDGSKILENFLRIGAGK